jgi:hypothetical protein
MASPVARASENQDHGGSEATFARLMKDPNISVYSMATSQTRQVAQIHITAALSS